MPSRVGAAPLGCVVGLRLLPGVATPPSTERRGGGQDSHTACAGRRQHTVATDSRGALCR